jgi:FAD/FMN-containing dehydrogenase
MDRIRTMDAANFTLTAEAGCILANVQAAAREADRLLALSLASEGTAQLGGLLSTNAGGTNVLRYGSARDQVLGLEVVLADGRIWDGLKGLRKDNTGYDLKQVFLGAEGTLGIVTAAVLKLFARPRERATAFVAIPSPQAAVDLFGLARERLGEDVTGFELVPRIGLDFVLRHIPETRDPLSAPAPWYVLVELGSARDGGLDRALESLLSDAHARGVALDAAIAQNEREADALWKLRDSLSEAQKPEGGSVKNDISVPVSAIPAFLKDAGAAMEAACPGIRPVAFGHIGDGNVHYNLSQPAAADRTAFLAQWEDLAERVEDIAVRLGGSISAEHGVGILKREALARTHGPVEIELQRRLKSVFDPHGILNPGKLLPDPERPDGR